MFYMPEFRITLAVKNCFQFGSGPSLGLRETSPGLLETSPGHLEISPGLLETSPGLL